MNERKVIVIVYNNYYQSHILLFHECEFQQPTRQRWWKDFVYYSLNKLVWQRFLYLLNAQVCVTVISWYFKLILCLLGHLYSLVKHSIPKGLVYYRNVVSIYQLNLWHSALTVATITPSAVSVACITLRWRHNGRDSVSNHQPHDCLLNRLFRRRS